MSKFSIPIFVQESFGFERHREPVRLGVPLPKGAVRNCDELGLQDPSENFVLLQKRALAYWSDRTVKWVLIDFFADVTGNDRVEYKLVADGQRTEVPAGSSDGIVITQREDGYAVDTKAAKFLVQSTNSGLLSSVQMRGASIFKSFNEAGFILTGSNNDPCYMKTQSFSLMEAGNLRSSMKASGKIFDSKHRPFLNFIALLNFFSGLSLVQIDFQIHNPQAALHPGGTWDLGDPGSAFFKDLSLQFKLDAGPENANAVLSYYEDPVPMDYETNSLNSVNSINTINSKNIVIYQDSSGGENWKSTNHIDQTGDLSVGFRGFKIFNDPSGAREIIGEGLRAVPLLKLETSDGWLASTVQDFWQNFPKALEFKNNGIRIGIFPGESKKLFELQGGEKKRHTLFLEFGSKNQEPCIKMFQQPLQVYVDPEWAEKSQAVSYFVRKQKNQAVGYESYISNVVRGPNSFFQKREKIDEFGWRNFGDIYADHEAVNHDGPEDFISHYNNQYDFIYGALIHFLRTGEKCWQELAYAAARHTIDIDIYHTDEDKAAYNHGLFWHTDHYRKASTCTHRTYGKKNADGKNYGGGPANEHNYSSGLLLYHYMTGEQEAAEAVMALAEWVLAMDEGSRTIFSWFDEGPTGLASQTARVDYHKPGRGAGNSINTLLDAYQLTNDRKYMVKAEELIQRCIHPKDDIQALKLDDPEHRWSYLVFLQILGKYLDLKAELGEMDYMFYYARDGLLHYAEWMAANEVPYKDVLHKVEIPTETWPAHDIRKCWVFHLAEKYGPPDKQNEYSKKAGFFFYQCLEDLLSFKTAYLTRPMVILTVYGYINAFFKKNYEHHQLSTDHSYDFGEPTLFEPQKSRIKSSIYKKFNNTEKIFKKYLAEQWYRLRSKLT